MTTFLIETVNPEFARSLHRGIRYSRNRESYASPLGFAVFHKDFFIGGGRWADYFLTYELHDRNKKTPLLYVTLTDYYH